MIAVRRLVVSFVAIAAVLWALPALAQQPERPIATVDSASGSSATVTIQNELEYAVTVINVRLAFLNDDGTRTFYYSQGNWQQELAAAGEEGSSWTGELTFAAEDGSAVPGDIDLSLHDGELVAAGYPVEPVIAPAEAALEGDDVDAVLEQLHLIRRRVPPLSISSRLFEAQIPASGLTVASHFDFERMEGLKNRLEEAVCEHASQRLLDAGSNSRRQSVYEELLPWIREQADLHISCINDEAKLAAARMLIAGDRPQDALAFSVRDEDGSIPEDWQPIYVDAHLALVRTALEMDAETFATFQRVLESLAQVRELRPEHEALSEVGGQVIPRVAAWVDAALARGDMADVLTIMDLLRPDWNEYEDVQRVSSTVAQSLIDSGIAFANRGQYVNARNEFVRGERIFEGVAEWEARREDINRFRALGVLQEARESAAMVTDPEAADRAYARLDEATQMYDLPQEDVDAFKSDIAQAYVDAAIHQLDEEQGFPMARHLLTEGESVAPNGRTDAMREAWLHYAELRYERGGITMRGADIEDAREAINLADGVDEGRASALERKLTMAYYSYRVGIPALALLLALIAGLVWLVNKRKAARYAQMDDI